MSRIVRRGAMLVAGALIVALADPAAAQNDVGRPADDRDAREAVVLEREVFHYDRAGRRDPFQPLPGAEYAGVRLDDLVLAGVLHNPDPRRSVAILTERGTDRRFRVRTGDRLGEIRIQAIHPDRVDLLVDERGRTRRETLQLPRPDRQRDNR